MQKNSKQVTKQKATAAVAGIDQRSLSVGLR